MITLIIYVDCISTCSDIFFCRKKNNYLPVALIKKIKNLVVVLYQKYDFILSLTASSKLL